MLENSATYGSTDSTDEQKRIYASNSLEYNLKDKQFCTLFPHYLQLRDEMKQAQDAAIKKNIQLQKQQQQQQQSHSNASTSNSDSTSSTSNIDAQPLLNGAASQHEAATNEQQHPQQQGAVRQQQPVANQHNHLVDKIVIVIVVVAIAFMLSYLYI